MKAELKKGAAVKLVRRPFFEGDVVSIQNGLPGFENAGGAHVHWRFMPKGWATRRPVPFHKLKVLDAQG